MPTLSEKFATADAIVYATARMLDADLLTCDAHFRALASVVFVDESGSGQNAGR